MIDIGNPGRAALAAAGLLILAGATPAWAGRTERVSVSSAGEQGNGDSDLPSISASGRFVAFFSLATNLVPGDTNGHEDVFVRDRVAGTTERVSVGPQGVQGDADSGDYGLGISADGRFVVFASDATNLVKGDTNSNRDVFVRDRKRGTTERVSVGPRGVQGDRSSAFFGVGALSADGRYVAFVSAADNFVPGDTNDSDDVFVRDRVKGTTERVSVSSQGAQGNTTSGDSVLAISADGRFVGFSSHATNLVPDDTNGEADVFVRDRLKGTTERISISSGGLQGNGSSGDAAISADGRFVAFASDATDLGQHPTNGKQNVFVHDLVRSTTSRASVGADTGYPIQGNFNPAISADGRFVAFTADRRDGGLQDVFVRDLRKHRTELVSVGPNGVRGNSFSAAGSLSADGHIAAFESGASDLVPNDTNGRVDIFVRIR